MALSENKGMGAVEMTRWELLLMILSWGELLYSQDEKMTPVVWGFTWFSILKRLSVRMSFALRKLVIQLRILFTDNLGQVIVVLLADVCFIPYIHDLIHFGDELLHELQVLVQVYTRIALRSDCTSSVGH